MAYPNQNSQIQQEQLIQALDLRGMVSKEASKELLENQRKAYKDAQVSLAGTAVLVDLTRRELIVRDHPSDEEGMRIPLGSSSGFLGFNPNEWLSFGSHLALVKPEDGSRLSEFSQQPGALYGMIVTKDTSYLYNEGRLHGDYLAESKQVIFNAIYNGPAQAAPYDLYLGGRWLCVSDRGAGNIMVIDTWNYEPKNTINIRDAGSTRSLNLAIDPDKDLAYISDNQSESLTILNLKTREFRRKRLDLGSLGNLALMPGGKYLYLLTIQPQEGLILLNTETWLAEKAIKLKGQLFCSENPDACDTLTLSPDGQQLLVMTYLDEPEAFTPVVTVFDAPQGKALRRYAYKDKIKPSQLVFGMSNPLKTHSRKFENLLMDAGLVTAMQLHELKKDIENGNIAPPPVAEPEPPPQIEVKAAEPEMPVAPPVEIDLPEAEDSDKVLNNQPQRGKEIELPPEALEEILEILVGTFQKQINEDISGYLDVMQRLREEAEKVRQELENYDSAIVQIDALFEGRHLQTVILREAILMMLDLKETQRQASLKSVPSNCPNCKLALLGSWDCQACGFEIESPERAAKRRIASAEAVANLPLGHLVMPDPQGLRLLQLNPYKYVVWHLDPEQLSCDYPVDSLWLPNQNVLMVDRDGHKVLEIGPRGAQEWKFDTDLSERHQLKDPVKVTYYLPAEAEPEKLKEDLSALHLLIVDQGQHRVLEVNRQHEILREFGIRGEAGKDGKHFDHPSDVQYTHSHSYLITDSHNHRVLEFDQKGALLRIFGAGLGLSKPTAAQRLLNDNTLILDSGNYRLLELDPQGQILHEALYYTPSIPEKFRVVSPIKMIRLINKDIVILDEDKLIQLKLKDKRLVWYSMIEDLAFQPKVAEPEIIVDENGVEQKVYNLVEHGHIKPVRLSQKINFKRMHKLIEARMRNEKVEAEDDGKSADAANRLRALIEDRKLEQKRNLQQELSLDTYQPSEIFEKADAELSNLRLYCLDRNHNAVIRINRKGEVKWHFGFEMGEKLNRPFHLSETKRTLLIADTGNNRILEINKADREVVMDFKGPAAAPLSGPRSAIRLSMGRTLIADQRKKRIVELDPQGAVVWEFNKSGQISSPQYAEELENGNILFTDTMLNSIREIDRQGNLCWSYGSRLKGNGPGQLFAPEFATRLVNGNTLIADTRNNRVLEVNYEGRELWICTGDPRTRRKLLNPVRAERLENGNTLIVYNNHREVVELSPAFETVWYFKMGNDVFLPPVHGDARAMKQLVEKLTPYYNPIEKRMILSASSSEMRGMEAHITLMDNCQMKSVRASLLLMTLERSATVVKTFPSPEELLADKFGKQLIVAVILDPGAEPEAVVEALSNIAEVEEVKLEPIQFEGLPSAETATKSETELPTNSESATPKLESEQLPTSASDTSEPDVLQAV